MSLVKTSPIIAIATGNGNAGVGIVRISGGEDDVKALLEEVPKLSSFKVNSTNIVLSGLCSKCSK